MHRLGIDVGGTHTDAVVLDENNKLVAKTKAPTTANVSDGIVEAMEKILTQPGVEIEKIGYAMLGTTHICVACLVLGNLFYMALSTAGLIRRRWFALMPAGALVPLYWALISVAFYRAAVQLVSRPFHWEKTRHGTSRLAA